MTAMVATGQEHVDLHVQFNCEGRVVLVQGNPDCFYKGRSCTTYSGLDAWQEHSSKLEQAEEDIRDSEPGQGPHRNCYRTSHSHLVRHQGLD